MALIMLKGALSFDLHAGGLAYRRIPTQRIRANATPYLVLPDIPLLTPVLYKYRRSSMAISFERAYPSDVELGGSS